MFSLALMFRSAAKLKVGFTMGFYIAFRGGLVTGCVLCSLGDSVSIVLLMFFHLGGDIYCKTVHTGTERVGLVA